MKTPIDPSGPLAHRRKKAPSILATAIAAALAVQWLLAGAASAVTTIWTDGTGSWFVPGNWSLGVPTAATDAQINNGGTAQIFAPGAVADSSILGLAAADSGTVLVDGPGSTWTTNGVLTVGNAGTGLLTIQNGGVVSDNLGTIGNATGNGTVVVTGAGSTWTNSGNLFVGNFGTGLLTIQNVGTVSNSLGSIGDQPGSIGTVLVTGAGSTLTNSGDLTVGRSGTGKLTIQTGGKVTTAGNGFIGNIAGSMGTVLVDGPGSTWTNSSFLNVGFSGTGLLTIQNGGKVSNTGGNIAFAGGTNGTVLVDGPGSTWTNSSFLEVGRFGTGLLTIQNGGVVNVNGGAGTVTLAVFPGSTGTLNIGALGGGTTAGTLNAATVTGGGGTAILNFNQTDTTTFAPQITGSIAVNQLGTGTTILTTGNTYSGATTINAGTLTLGFGAVSTNILPSASALVLGGGTLSLTGPGTQTVNGLTTTANTSSGIRLGTNETLTLGALTSAGAGSALNFNTAPGGANAAAVGSGVVVLTGQTAGDVINPNFTVTDAGGFGLATVNGANQVIRLISTLLPASGAVVTTDYLINNNAGGPTAAGSSTLTVTASESAKSVTVDTTAASGVLTLNSGVVLSSDRWNFGGNGSKAYLITGSAGGAGLTSATAGGPITLNNYNTAAVTISSPILDNGGSSLIVNGSGTTILTGASTYTGATTINAGTLEVSAGGAITATSGMTVDGTLTIQTGGKVSNTVGTIGNVNGSNGTALVDGPGSTWTNSGDLTVGNDGTGLLTIQNGGTVSNTIGSIGVNTGSMGTVLVTGAGSAWTNSGGLRVGKFGTGLLTIQTGGAVSNTFGIIGDGTGDKGTVLVDGPGSTWTNSSSLEVGSFSTGRLTIENGGTVSNTVGLIGNRTGSNGTVLVDGPGSTWTNSGFLDVGRLGTGLLTIQNGGKVSNTDGLIGVNGGSKGTVLVTDPGSTWTNSGNLTVGLSGTGLLTIQNGGVVNVNGGAGTILAANAGSIGTLNIGALGGGTTAGTLNVATVTGGRGTAILNFNQTDTITFSPQITGSIAVNQLGTGTTILPGANAYSGGTIISAGTLRTLNAGPLNFGNVALTGGDLNPVGPLIVNNLNWGAGRVVLANPSADLGATGDILNATTLTKNPGGGTYALGQVAQNVTYTLTTFGTNSGFTSGTDFTAQSINPNVTLVGAFTLNASNVQFLITGATAMLGSGSVLQNSGPVFLPTFADVTVTGPVTTGGPGENNTVNSLTFQPGSSLQIFNTLFVSTSPVNVPGGASIILGSPAGAIGNLSVSQLNLLFGSFLIGNGTILGDLNNIGGTVSPGFSPGKIYVTGNYTQGSNGTLRIEIGGRHSGEHDELVVGGRATLDGTLELVRLNNFHPRRGDKITFLTANGGVDGEFAHVSNPFETGTILEADVVYHDHSVALEMVRGSFEKFAEHWRLTPNQRSVAEGLDSLSEHDGDHKALVYLDERALGHLPADFDRIAPEELTSIFTISTALATVQSVNTQRRTADIRSGSSGFSASGLAVNGTGPGYNGPMQFSTGAAGPTGKESKESKEVKELAPPEEKRWGAFLTGVGEWVDVDGDGNARGYEITTGGFTLGLDYKVCPNFALGVLAGYAGTGADLTNGGSVLVNGGKLGVYATTFVGGWYADAAVTGGLNGYDTKRSALQGTARGSTNGGELDVLAATGYDWKIGALSIGPTATFNYTLVGMDSFTEHGSLAPLTIGNRNSESVRSAFGFKASYDSKIWGLIVKHEIRAAWQHEYGDSSYGLDATFANGAGNGFLVNGPEIGRDSLLIGAGFAIQCSERCATYLYYDGELGRSNFDRHAVSGGVRVAF